MFLEEFVAVDGRGYFIKLYWAGVVIVRGYVFLFCLVISKHFKKITSYPKGSLSILINGASTL